eukprot:6972033-Prymnesium_polylepis.2
MRRTQSIATSFANGIQTKKRKKTKHVQGGKKKQRNQGSEDVLEDLEHEHQAPEEQEQERRANGEQRARQTDPLRGKVREALPYDQCDGVAGRVRGAHVLGQPGQRVRRGRGRDRRGAAQRVPPVHRRGPRTVVRRWPKRVDHQGERFHKLQTSFHTLARRWPPAKTTRR